MEITSGNFNQFYKKITAGFNYRLFLLIKLPMAWLSGMQLKVLTEEECVIALRYKWINTNPFKSMYFAVQAMAAEMSTGLLASAFIYNQKPGVSMLVVHTSATYTKTIKGKVEFVCKDGQLIQEAIEKAIVTREAQTATVTSNGITENGDIASTFSITWSFKVKGSGLKA